MKLKIFHLRQTGSFSLSDPFLTTFYYVKKLNGILRKNRGRGLTNLTYAYMGVREGLEKYLHILTWGEEGVKPILT